MEILKKTLPMGIALCLALACISGGMAFAFTAQASIEKAYTEDGVVVESTITVVTRTLSDYNLTTNRSGSLTVTFNVAVADPSCVIYVQIMNAGTAVIVKGELSTTLVAGLNTKTIDLTWTEPFTDDDLAGYKYAIA